MTESKNEMAERFARDTAAHELTVLRDDGFYKHLNFTGVTTMPDGKVSKTSAYWFELITWPGSLVINGDMGAVHFSRAEDMIAFFRRPADRIDPGYWAQKVCSGRDGLRTYDRDHFRELVLDDVKDAEEDWPGLAEAIEKRMFSLYSDLDTGHEDAARRSLEEFGFGDTWTASCLCGESIKAADEMEALRWRSGHINTGNGARRHHSEEQQLVEGFRFQDTWEWDLSIWAYHYLWACHAIVWGIRQYDQRAAESATELAASNA